MNEKLKMNKNLKEAFDEFNRIIPQPVNKDIELFFIKKIATEWNVEETDLHNLIRKWKNLKTAFGEFVLNYDPLTREELEYIKKLAFEMEC